MLKLGSIGNLEQGTTWDGKDQRDVYQLFISYDSGNLVGLQIKFDYPSEYITWLKIEGTFSNGVVRLAMKTNLGKCFGPFPFKSNYEMNDEMLATGYYLGEENQFGGFYGTADKLHGLRSLGVYVKPVSSLDAALAEKSSHVAGEEALKIEWL
ncbi:unnamed protein product [Rhodiola kirilowii]